MKVVYYKTVFIFIFSALVIILSLGINDLFHDIKEHYIDDKYPRILSDIIYISFVIFLIIVVYTIARVLNIDVVTIKS
jgi:hypothetical protein